MFLAWWDTFTPSNPGRTALAVYTGLLDYLDISMYYYSMLLCESCSVHRNFRPVRCIAAHLERTRLLSRIVRVTVTA